MEKKDVGASLKKGLLGAADSIKTAAKNVKVPEIKKESRPAPKPKPKQEESVVRAVTTENAIKIFYYLMAVDGEVFHSEEEKFDEIGAQLDSEYADHKETIVKECKKQLEKMIDEGDYYDVVQDGVEEAILVPQNADSFITPKLLVWNLLTIAYSDEHCDEKEKRLMKYIVRKLNIDAAIFLEMENSLQTLMDIEKETQWIKTTKKPYLAIEAQVNELAVRRDVIFESVKDLITL